MRSSTATSSGSSIPAPDSAMRFLARVRRAAIVASGTRKAAATEAVGTPHPEAHRQRDLHLLGQRRVTAQHDEAQLVVEHGRGVDEGVGGLGGQVAGGGDRRQPLAEPGQPADAVDGAAPCRRQQPGLDRVGDASVGPGLQGEGEGVGGRLLGDVDVACHPQRGGEHAAPVQPLGVGRRGRRVIRHIRRGSPRSGAPRCSRAAPGSARRSCGHGRRRRPRRGSSRRGSP